MNGYEQTLLELARADERIVVMTAENRAPIFSLPAALGPRFVDVGICEQTLVGTAAGLALRGRTPVAHALAAFLTMRAFEFIRTDVGVAALPVKLIGFIPGFLSEANGPTHQALEDVALMRSIPGMHVLCPADAEQLAEALPQLVASPAPTYVRYTNRPPAVAHREAFQFGKAETLAEGDDVTLLSHGVLLDSCHEASRLLAARGVAARLLNLHTLEPVDDAALRSAAVETRLLVTVEDHFERGGLFTLVAETLQRHGLNCALLSVSMEKRFFRPAALAAAIAHEGFGGAAIAERVLARLRR
jgi:transketolase